MKLKKRPGDGGKRKACFSRAFIKRKSRNGSAGMRRKRKLTFVRADGALQEWPPRNFSFWIRKTGRATGSLPSWMLKRKSPSLLCQSKAPAGHETRKALQDRGSHGILRAFPANRPQ